MGNVHDVTDEQHLLDASSSGRDVRRLARAGRFSGHTSGIARNYVQGNVVIVPRELAYDFLLYCQRNPKPCPLLAVGDAGDPALPSLGEDVDIRTDVPRYRVWRDGRLVEERTDIVSLWRDDLVAFVLGCSFSFEAAMLAAGIPLRHIACGDNVAMFKTSIATTPAGRFHGPLVVSMRPLSASDAIRAVQVTSRYPNVHGAPVHLGDPAAIGIGDLQQPDFGDAISLRAGEIPVFWACGVTPQAAVMATRPAFAITHAPGAMLFTDLMNEQLAAL